MVIDFALDALASKAIARMQLMDKKVLMKADVLEKLARQTVHSSYACDNGAEEDAYVEAL